jgi:alpha-beta hydrolase superfamily lysophospholipase
VKVRFDIAGATLGDRARAGLILAAVMVGLAACASPVVMERGPARVTPLIEPSALVAGDTTRLPLDVWVARKPRAILVAVHGFNGYARDFALAGPWFARHGVTVYAYDQRGFGRHERSRRGLWAGSDVLSEDLSSFTAMVRKRHTGLPVYVLGFSMGGAVAMTAASEGLAADGVILVAPAIWGWRAMNPFYKSALWLTAHAVPGKTATGSSLDVWPSDNIEALRAYARDPLNIKQTRFDSMYGLVGLMDEAHAAAGRIALPVLYLYGARDEIVPAAASRDSMRRIEAPKRLAIYGQGWHMLLHDRQRETVYRDILAWMRDRDAALPSGEETLIP